MAFLLQPRAVDSHEAGRLVGGTRRSIHDGPLGRTGSCEHD